MLHILSLMKTGINYGGSQMNVLLLGDIGSRSIIATLRALKQYDINIYLAFNHRKIVHYATYHSYLQNPFLYYDSSSKNQFINSLISFRKEIGEYILIPSGEELLRWVIQYQDILMSKDIIIPTVDIETYITMSDKENFIRECQKHGLDIPPEHNNAKKILNRFINPFVIKPKEHTVDEKVLNVPFLVENKKSFDLLKKKELDLSKHLIQEYISGPSFYYLTYYEKGNKQIAFCQKNIVQKPGGGSVLKAIPYELPTDLVNTIDSMLTSIKWHGLIMIEVKMDSNTNTFYAIEANARIWGPLQLSIDNGYNFPVYLLGMKPFQSEQKKNCGYLWIFGYLTGFISKIKTKTDFQIYQSNTQNKIIFQDVWFRKDTLLYFILEPLFFLFSSVPLIIGILRFRSHKK